MSSRRLTDRIKGLLDKEIGTVYKPHAGRLRFALAFPNTYHLGMSNLGFQTVYRLLNDRDDCVCERVFLPDEPEADELLRTRSPLITMESRTPVREFDVLAFSVSYEMDYPNALRIMALSGIAELSRERNPSHPLVIAGGPAATFNPEVLAPFVDAFVIGEAEEVLPELVDVLSRDSDGGRDDLLLGLAHIPGVYVPRFYDPEYNDDGTLSRFVVREGVPETVSRRWSARLGPVAAASAILTPETEFSNMILAEVARGCGRRCRFCVAGHIGLPARAYSTDSVLEGISRADEVLAKPTATKPRIGLVGASVFDHPSSLLICESLVERERLFSISSTRADTLDRDIVDALKRGGQETLTIAPEAGTERLRHVINKGMTDEDITSGAAIAWDGGFRRLKLYFMVGLPTETDEDISGIVSLVARIGDAFAWERLTVSISCFVPKPWTPFQWAAMESERTLSEKLRKLRSLLRASKRVAVVGESARESVIQAVLARGDRRLEAVLLFRSREDLGWRSAFRRTSVGVGVYAQRARQRDELFPWDHIRMGITKEDLWREYERSGDR